MSSDYKSRISEQVNESAIGQLLSKMSMESLFYISSTLQSPWAIAYPPLKKCMIFHRVLEGSVTVEVEGKQTHLHKGDFALLPLGKGHCLSDGSNAKPTPLFQLPIHIAPGRYETLRHGGSGNECKLICGAVTFTHPLTQRLIKILPSILTVRSDTPNIGHVVKTLNELILDEVKNMNAGTTGVTAKLADLLVITAIRNYLDNEVDHTQGWFGALEDPRITKAIELVHESPSKHWSLTQLAQEVGMSRTNFAVQFKQLVGNSPIDYLTEWRMSLAYSALKQTKDTILSIALDYGYQSESSFSRAFKKVIGTSPSEIRKVSEAT
ncbi:AraC family transcriptional regulator [Alteromonas facilis]|uniref:AraC family transcriptional regulator n=1 Tax=Alteromonas facilis TaxID=2048004 RepID=UPI000C2959B9|nr:AraC family transcriptional regulator [Alteromonas facilis]